MCPSMPKTGRIELEMEPVTGESDQGAASDAARQCDSRTTLPTLSVPSLAHRGEPAATRALPLLFFWFRRGPMLLKLHSSNRIEWPLGTGRSSMHGMRLTDSPRRSTFGQKGTAQGNRGSAAQGGIRQHSGFLPFQTSGDARVRAIATNPFPTLSGFERGQSGVCAPGSAFHR